MTRILAAPLAGAALALVMAASAPAAGAPQPANPIDIFVGHSHGHGMLKVMFKSPQPVDVDNYGKLEPDGDLEIVQKVDDHKSAPRSRRWLIRPSGPGRYVGSMDDAVGPIDIRVSGNKATFAYVDHDGNHFQQVLTIAGPRVVINELRVKRFGLTVARMTETIRKLD